MEAIKFEVKGRIAEGRAALADLHTRALGQLVRMLQTGPAKIDEPVLHSHLMSRGLIQDTTQRSSTVSRLSRRGFWAAVVAIHAALGAVDADDGDAMAVHRHTFEGLLAR